MQKAFRSSPFISYCSIAFGILLLAFTSSCTFNPDKQKPGQAYLQGEWQQDSVAGQKRLLDYSLYRLTFTCDSFFMKIDSHSKVNADADSCTRKGYWTEYCKGTYTQRNDTVKIKGEFCNANKSVKDERTCLRYGIYEEYFKIAKKTDSLITFTSTSNVIPINARLIKRTSCIPKPL